MTEILQDRITRRTERNPDATAVVMNRERMSYSQLEELSNQLARLLRAGGCQKGDRVCLLTPKSPMAIVGMLGVAKAGGIYVPLDTASPAPRLARIVESCQPRWVLGVEAVTPLLEELLAEEQFRRSLLVGWLDRKPAGGNNFRIEFLLEDLAQVEATRLESRTYTDDPLYILFTSGSTGTPKGVPITQSNVIHFIDWAQRYFGIDSSDRLSGHSPFHFDLSVFDIYGALTAGAELHLVPSELNLLPTKLADFIRESGLTQWFSVPSVLSYMAKFDAVRFDDFPTLKRLLWCGEVLPTPVLIYWMKRLPKVTFTNLYGPTETTIASSYYTIPQCPQDEKAPIPIGVGCEGEELLVLDEEFRSLPPGQVGDLYIRGVGLSPGYWRDQEKTERVFLPNPSNPSDRLYRTGDLASVGEDGLIYFHGREDSQIKSRGYRIELGEIETALNALEGLRECAVVAINSNGFEGTAICCAYVEGNKGQLTPAILRHKLTKLLPSYMLPSRWMAVDKLPKNPNGKIDRPQLRKQFEQNETEAS